MSAIDPAAQAESALRRALKHAASALKAEGIGFALAGGYALWVHGAPEPEHDVDFVVAEDDTETAVRALAAAGFTIERPPEDWLFKAHLDGAMVDVLHRLQGIRLERSVVAQAEVHEILGLRIPVMAPTQIMAAKLGALSEHSCDLAPLLGVTRAVREQVDWSALRTQFRDHPYAEAFLFLCERLGIAVSGR